MTQHHFGRSAGCRQRSLCCRRPVLATPASRGGSCRPPEEEAAGPAVLSPPTRKLRALRLRSPMCASLPLLSAALGGIPCAPRPHCQPQAGTVHLGVPAPGQDIIPATCPEDTAQVGLLKPQARVFSPHIRLPPAVPPEPTTVAMTTAQHGKQVC